LNGPAKDAAWWNYEENKDRQADQRFDTWLKTFQSMGGDKVTKEGNDWYKSSQSK
jgi:hypothetical protein